MTDRKQADRPQAAVPEHKQFRVAHFKALTKADPPGSFEAIMAVFDNIDSYGDRMRTGAFVDTLEKRGLPPIVWSHDWMTPPIGATSDADEVEAGKHGDHPAGLFVKGRYFIDTAAGEDSPIARQVWTAQTAVDGKGQPVLREFSFGYRTKRAQWVEEDPETLPADAQWTEGMIRDLLAVDLYEVGPTLVGANPDTALLAAKAAALAARAGGADLTSEEFRSLLGGKNRDGSDGNRDGNGDAPKAQMPEDVRARLDAIGARRPIHT
jgi:uncharacterized protein